MSVSSDTTRRKLVRVSVWCALFGIVAGFVSWKLGVFELWKTVEVSTGEAVRLPNTFAAVDHPFHATRAETLRRSLADGEILRWIGHHQGGYPVEFYPLGAAWIEVIVWAILLGTTSMLVVHKLVVIGVFLLPALGFLALGRSDRLTPAVAFLALAIHVSVRGWWWSGGFMELVEWGLLTNVASASLLPLFMVSLAQAVWKASSRFGSLAAILAAIAVYTNARTIVPLAAIGIGFLIVEVWQSDDAPKRVITGLAGIGMVSILLLAPLIIALARFRDLYVFVPFSGYETASDFLDSSIRAVSTPVFLFMIVGLAFSLARPVHRIATVVGATLVTYVVVTALFGLVDVFGDALEQLEVTRLMPFQRLLMIYLAAYGVYSLVEWLVRQIVPAKKLIADVSLVGAAILVLVLYVGPLNLGIPESDKALASVATTGDVRFAELEAAVRLADERALDGTTVLVLGSSISWHDQLWAPVWSDRMFFYDDWLWYWQTDHSGDYDPLTQHAYRSDQSALDPAYLDEHGIGAIVVTGEASSAARSAGHLLPLEAGQYQTYLVEQPVTVVTGDGGNSFDAHLENQTVSARLRESAVQVRIRRNWFPRWTSATEGVVMTKDDSGYFRGSAPETADVVLQYETDVFDWIARALMLLGLAICSVAVIRPERIVRRF